MTLNKTFEFQPTSTVQAAAFGSVTMNSIYALSPNSNNAAAFVKIGLMSANCQLTADFYGCLESSATAPETSFASLTLTALSTGSQAVAVNTNPLFPYAKVKVICKAGSGTGLFENLVARLVTD